MVAERELTPGEAEILAQVRQLYGETGTACDVFVSNDDEAIVWVRASLKGVPFIVNLTLRARERSDGACLESIRDKWLRQPDMPPGTRLRLSGGYDMEPAWLKGRQSYHATLLGFLDNKARDNPDESRSALIEFYEELRFEGLRGTHGVLSLRYVGQQWMPNGTVHAYLLRDKIESIDQMDEATSRHMESHASYEVL